MTDEQKAAYVMAMAACALGTIAGMQAENQACLHANRLPFYNATDFEGVAERYGIHHNAVLTTFQGDR